MCRGNWRNTRQDYSKEGSCRLYTSRQTRVVIIEEVCSRLTSDRQRVVHSNAVIPARHSAIVLPKACLPACLPETNTYTCLITIHGKWVIGESRKFGRSGAVIRFRHAQTTLAFVLQPNFRFGLRGRSMGIYQDLQRCQSLADGAVCRRFSNWLGQRQRSLMAVYVRSQLATVTPHR